ncbi:MAG: S9 family peptidase [Chloroflexota bacterium]
MLQEQNTDLRSAVTAEMIADISIPNDVQLSPNGRMIVYVLAPNSKRNDYATSALWLAWTDNSQPPKQFTSATARDHQPRWSPDGTQIAFLSDRAERGIDQLYTIPVDGGEAQALTPTSHKKPVRHFAWSPDSTHIAFTSADEPTEEDEEREQIRDDAQVYGERWLYARLRLLNCTTGDIVTLVSIDRHIAESAWSPQGDELAYIAWDTPELESLGHGVSIERIALTEEAAHIICWLPQPARNVTWNRDGQSLLFEASSTNASQSSNAIWSVALTDGTPTRIAPGADKCAAGYHQPHIGTRPMVVVGTGLETHLQWLDPTTGMLEHLYPQTDEDRTTELVSWSFQSTADDHTALAVIRSSGNQPWELWATQMTNTQTAPVLQQITHHQTALEQVPFGKQEPFLWTAPDGTELDGVLIRPPDAPEGQHLPMVTLVHGGPYGRSGQGMHLSWAHWGQWLALAGYAVLLPNPRGGFGHGEAFAAVARGDVGGTDYGDVISAVDTAVARGIADSHRLAIGGWSQGGFMSAWAVTQTTRFKAAIVGAGPTDWGMMALTSDVPAFELELGGSAPWDGAGPHKHVALSPISFASRIKTPTLILHGANDARVPLNQAIGFHRALRAFSVPTELVVYPREPHHILERSHQIDLLTRVRAWIDRWL